MPWEGIGSLDTGSVPGDGAWIHWCQRFAKSCTLMVCGDPPPGCDLDLTGGDHALGSYPTPAFAPATPARSSTST